MANLTTIDGQRGWNVFPKNTTTETDGAGIWTGYPAVAGWFSASHATFNPIFLWYWVPVHTTKIQMDLEAIGWSLRGKLWSSYSYTIAFSSSLRTEGMDWPDVSGSVTRRLSEGCTSSIVLFVWMLWACCIVAGLIKWPMACVVGWSDYTGVLWEALPSDLSGVEMRGAFPI